jgi:hypothetical protein
VSPPLGQRQRCGDLDPKRGVVPLSAGFRDEGKDGWQRVPVVALLREGGSRLLSISRGAVTPSLPSGGGGRSVIMVAGDGSV